MERKEGEREELSVTAGVMRFFRSVTAKVRGWS